MLLNQEIVFSTFLEKENGLRSLKFCGISCQRSMAANETIRLPVFVLIRNLYKFCLAAYLVL